jgi:hypothetical protein
MVTIGFAGGLHLTNDAKEPFARPLNRRRPVKKGLVCAATTCLNATQTERFTFLEDRRLKMIAVGSHALLFESRTRDQPVSSHPGVMSKRVYRSINLRPRYR